MNNLFPFPEYHEMKYDDEKQEWYCQECAYRFKFEENEIIIIEKKNTNAIHGGSLGGLRVRSEVKNP